MHSRAHRRLVDPETFPCPVPFPRRGDGDGNGNGNGNGDGDGNERSEEHRGEPLAEAMNRRDFFKQAASIGASIGGCAFFAGLFGPSGTGVAALRPPGALSEDDFVSTCIRCLRCVDACPNKALTPTPTGGVDGGTPTMQPRVAACMLCMDTDGDYLKCTEACPSGALRLTRKDADEIRDTVKIGVAEIDTGLCYSYNNWSCGACFRACPLAGEALTLGNWERPIVHPDKCVGCGCCERSCIRYPHAIRVRPVEDRR